MKEIPMLTAAQVTIAKIWNQPKGSSTDDWINKYDIQMM